MACQDWQVLVLPKNIWGTAGQLQPMIDDCNNFGNGSLVTFTWLSQVCATTSEYNARVSSLLAEEVPRLYYDRGFGLPICIR